MGRKKIPIRRLENPADRKLAYEKQEKWMVKRAKGLSVRFNTDVALIMFSPVGSLTAFGSNGRVEDIFLRFLDTPCEQRGGLISNEEFLYAKLNQLKHEREILEKIARIEYLKEKLDKLDLKRHQAQEKMRYYEPNLETITSVVEVGVHERFLANALQRTQLLKDKIQGNQLVPENTERTVMSGDATSANNDYSVDGNQNGIYSMEAEVQNQWLRVIRHLELDL